MKGRLDALWSKRAHRGPMDARDQLTLVAGRGVDGSVGRSSRRQVTILSQEGWTAALQELGKTVAPQARRANLLISGLDLEQTRGQILRVGPCRLAIGGELTPCERMDEAAAGLRTALVPHWRGGVFAQVLEGGVVRVGDRVEWERVDAGVA